MSARSMFRKSTDESIAHVRSLFPAAGVSRRKALPASLINREICGPILDKLNLAAYKETTIIDMNPNLGVFSAALHERLQPKQHILLEPEKVYEDRMKQFQKSHKNSWYIPLDGYSWNTYNELFSNDPPPHPWPDKFPKPRIQTMAPPDGINTDLLFVGNMGQSIRSERLIAQFISCCALGSWIQRYGRVRFLLWVASSTRDKYLPRSIAARAKPAATSEAVVDITEVATSNVIRQGKGFQKLPVITPDNVHIEELKPILSKRQEIKSMKLQKIKLNIKPKLVEDLIKKLVAEELSFAQSPGIRGRPRKLSREHQKELERTTAKVRKIVEALRDGKKPKVPSGLSRKESMKVLNRYDEIRNTFGYKSEVEVEAENVAKAERQKLRAPGTTGRPPKLPKRGEPPTVEQLKAIEDKITKNPGLWIRGMEHPPWYYHGNKRQLRELATRIATMHPALWVDPKGALPQEDVYSTTVEAGGDLPKGAAAGRRPSITSASVGDRGDRNSARVWEDYEEQWSRRNEVKSRTQAREDEIYAAHNKLLGVYNQPYEPLSVDPKKDFFPPTAMTLLDITPKYPHPFFSPPTPRERENNWLTFEWLLRHLFVLRASSVISALRCLAPGAENILADLPADQMIPPTKRVRCLGTQDLVNLTMAWQRWPFRALGIEFEQHVERDFRSTDVPVF